MKLSRLLDLRNQARQLADHSTCEQFGTAALVTNASGSKVYAAGVNGGPVGGMHCLCDVERKSTCIHAEVNALVQCGPKARNKVMICTLSPCISCAALIINAGIKKVYYITLWKSDIGITMLRQAHVEVEHISVY